MTSLANIVDAVLSAPLRLFRFIDRQNPYLVGIVPLALLVHLMLGAFDPRVYNGGDNALYWALGRSLATLGEYRNIGAPGAPFETSIPWGYPAMLALGMKVLPDGYVYLKAIPWACMLGAMICLWCFLQHLLRGHRTLALLVMLLCVANYRLIVYAALLLTEAPYLLLSMGCLLSFEWFRQRVPDRWWGILPAASCASFAYLVRPAGVALVVALVGYLALSRRWVALTVTTLVILALPGTWHVRCLTTPSDEENLYLSYLVKKSKWQADDEKVDTAGIIDRVGLNAYNYARRPLTQLSLGRKWKEPRLHPIAIGLALLIALGFVLSLVRPGPVHLYLPLYTCVLLAWLPESVKDRYLAMIYPLLMALAALALWWLLAFLWPRLAPLVVAAAALMLLMPQLRLCDKKIERCEEIRSEFVRGYDQQFRRKSYRSYVKMCTWLSKQSRRDAVLAARKPRLAYYYADRPALRVTLAVEPKEVFQWLVDEEIDYVILDHIDGRVKPTRDRLKPTINAYPEHFTRVYKTDVRDSVFQFRAELTVPATEQSRAHRLKSTTPQPGEESPEESEAHAAEQ